MKSFKNVHFFDKKTLDITSENDIDGLFKNLGLILLSTLLRIPMLTERKMIRELSYLINAKSLDYLSNSCARYQALLIHFSTDYVFDGEKKDPYIELDNTNPINYYGKTKLLGEENITRSRCRFLILEYLGYTVNLVKTFTRLFLNSYARKII